MEVPKWGPSDLLLPRSASSQALLCGSGTSHHRAFPRPGQPERLEESIWFPGWRGGNHFLPRSWTAASVPSAHGFGCENLISLAGNPLLSAVGIPFLFQLPKKGPSRKPVFVSLGKALNKPSPFLFLPPSFFLPIPSKLQSPVPCKEPLLGARTMSHGENSLWSKAVFTVASSVAGTPPSLFTVSNSECADTGKSDHRVHASQPGRENRRGNVRATLDFSPPCFPADLPPSQGSSQPSSWAGWQRVAAAHLLLLFPATPASSQCFYFGG